MRPPAPAETLPSRSVERILEASPNSYGVSATSGDKRPIQYSARQKGYDQRSLKLGALPPAPPTPCAGKHHRRKTRAANVLMAMYGACGSIQSAHYPNIYIARRCAMQPKQNEMHRRISHVSPSAMRLWICARGQRVAPCSGNRAQSHTADEVRTPED